MFSNIKTIAFDADDTLWINETYFREAERKFGQLLESYETLNKIDQELFKIEIDNLPYYGYDIKGFVLSMLETALKLSNNQINPKLMMEILAIGKEMMDKPVQLLEDVKEVLSQLSKKYRLVVATKGDLIDQERKLQKSGVLNYFHHIEIMSEKHQAGYTKLIKHLDIKPSEFLMVGNSLKSDILPVIKIGAQAIHVPFHTTWQHEKIHADDTKNLDYHTLGRLSGLFELMSLNQL